MSLQSTHFLIMILFRNGVEVLKQADLCIISNLLRSGLNVLLELRNEGISPFTNPDRLLTD